MPSVYLIITGSVQGVGLRYSMRQKARELGLAGWVKNNRDGTVTACIQGEEEHIKKLIDWLSKEAFSDLIESITSTSQSPDPSLRDFHILY